MPLSLEMGLCQAPCTASHSSWEPSSQRGDPVGIGGPWVWARSSAPAPPGAVLMFRLDFGYSCALDSGACGQAGALGTALLHREWEGVGTQPMAPTAQEMRVLSLGKCFPAHPGRSAHAFPPRTAGGFRPRKPREQQLYVNHSGTGCQGIPTRIGKGLSAPSSIHRTCCAQCSARAAHPSLGKPAAVSPGAWGWHHLLTVRGEEPELSPSPAPCRTCVRLVWVENRDATLKAELLTYFQPQVPGAGGSGSSCPHGRVLLPMGTRAGCSGRAVPARARSR